jgi:pyrroline-5-carboxylate reductase
MAAESGLEPATLREQVTSKGGTTAAALEVLETAGLRATVRRAVDAAARRSVELATQSGVG